MAVESLRDLFLYEMSSMHDAEKKICSMLHVVAGHLADVQVRQLFQHHEQATQQQIKRLEHCFEVLDARPSNVPCLAIQGIQQDYQRFLEQAPTPLVHAAFSLGAVAKIEHFEIAAYRAMVAKALLLRDQECGRLLGENLRQEEDMAVKIEHLGRQMGQQLKMQMSQPTDPRMIEQPPEEHLGSLH